MRLGKQKQGDRTKHLTNVTDADFYQGFEFTGVRFPGGSELHIEVWGSCAPATPPLPVSATSPDRPLPSTATLDRCGTSRWWVASSRTI